MALIPTFDPLSGEARSPLLAGLTEGLNKISAILDMATTQHVDMPLEEIYISEDKKHLLYQASFGNKLWLTSPTPVVKVNGIVTSAVYDLDPVGGGIRFQEPLQESDVVTVTVTGITNSSAVIDGLLSGLQQVQAVADKYKGFYATSAGLNTAHATGTDGDYAIVGETNSFWVWSSVEGKFKDTFRATDLSAYITADEISKLYITKEKATRTFPTKENVRQDLMLYAVHQQLD